MTQVVTDNGIGICSNCNRLVYDESIIIQSQQDYNKILCSKCLHVFDDLRYYHYDVNGDEIYS